MASWRWRRARFGWSSTTRVSRMCWATSRSPRTRFVATHRFGTGMTRTRPGWRFALWSCRFQRPGTCGRFTPRLVWQWTSRFSTWWSAHWSGMTRIWYLRTMISFIFWMISCPCFWSLSWGMWWCWATTAARCWRCWATFRIWSCECYAFVLFNWYKYNLTEIYYFSFILLNSLSHKISQITYNNMIITNEWLSCLWTKIDLKLKNR